MRITNEISAS
ncbi:hypothetical protein CGLO_18330 [Colletotrichum gloeosporioides Cg-14]|uniref:Uncharacterized protein n=1 Tax=Colletotrichum gloeosporioides (strain Cg-14) TaxID=1237896 RepID=T0JUR6_COLGC|nr:hypothetical protein CGLO_18330 [Colletotrichum gloeosporioides Cg-14]